LKNGLKLLVIEDHTSPTFAYQTWFKVGSRNEIPGHTGLAHLFEHMMFKGTKNLGEGEFDRLLEGLGAEDENAFTSRDYTAYVQEVPRGNLEIIAKAESDRMMNLIIDETSFKTEREVVQNERRYRNENNPDGLMDQELFRLAFKRHSYQWPVIGTPEDLDHMSVQDALDFYHSYYSPNHATVIVVGDVVPSEVLATVEKYYGNLPSRKLQPLPSAGEPPQTSPRRKQLRLNIQAEKIVMGFPIPNFQNQDYPAIDVLQTLLSGGKSSRLSRVLVDTGIATTANAYGFENSDPTLFLISVNLQKKKHAAEAESIILRELHRMNTELVPQVELERAKNRINFSFFTELESSYEKAYFLGQYETLTGDFATAIAHQKKMQAVTAKDIQRIVRTYFDPRSRTVITGVPKATRTH